MKARRWIALGIGAFILVFSVITSLSLAMNTYSQANWLAGAYDESVVIQEGDPSGSIALLEVNGAIINTTSDSLFSAEGYNHSNFMDLFYQTMSSPNVEGIIIAVDSPGGGVLESAEIHDAVIEAQENYGKPVYISMGSMAASGGYYLAAPAEQIFAYPQTLTGSIGVIMSSLNITELLDKIGVEETVYKSGPYKDMMSGTRPPTEEEDEILQSIVDEYYDEFVEVIANGRGMDEERVRELGDGRIYTGRQALEAGLIDELGSINDVIAAMQRDLGSNYQVIAIEPKQGLTSMFGLAAEKIFGKAEQKQGLMELTEYNQPRAMYLYDYE
ncbi:signal peptide peptidase SppA [Shouchella clausii]|uniref:Signal peptidase SppA n=3 Tax=Shouchella TaxID=2893057 RepID=Q5WEC8_SHOC1|nr:MULTISPECIES: signal peptide peptidase SppA [Shouchella]MCM3313479.1 signal peptide peptidase SppA [Psychrobacillus sp. MER TA 17]ALA54330.1 Protease IV [Shouchella clausii]KKI86471.1 hypothetical protein WZ76_10795 [Shouchella clausii]MBU3232557.1 signal peptide peptidase SppA [Shouchella clausii]MBU3265935.1 signal peptide peptidase SppA [Shouchella clausii]